MTQSATATEREIERRIELSPGNAGAAIRPQPIRAVNE